MSAHVSDKNRRDWEAYAEKYSGYEHQADKIDRIVQQPAAAFDPAVWNMLTDRIPSFQGLRVCVPSSGNNHAVFAFALLGAEVMSCDISQNQLSHAQAVAQRLGLTIDFRQADTMALDGVPSAYFDLVFTSNGVHVWIDDLPAMYGSIARVLKPGGRFAMYEVHPFCRPFDGKCLTELKVIKPYDVTGPFEDPLTVRFGWRIQDIINAMVGAGLALERMEEPMPAINYDEPDWIACEDLVNAQGHSMEAAEIKRRYDWRNNPFAALPQWIAAIAQKG